MPYTYKKNADGSHTVYKKDTGEKVGTTHGDVRKYLAALHINVKEQANPAQARAMSMRTAQVTGMGGSSGGSSGGGPTQVSGPTAMAAPKAMSGPTQVSGPSSVSGPSQASGSKSENEILENYLITLQE